MRRLLIALAVLAALPATASAELALGIQDDAFLSSAEPNAWPLAQALHPDVIRYNVDWSSVAATQPKAPADPSDPAYAWTAVDGIVAHAAAHGGPQFVQGWIEAVPNQPAFFDGERRFIHNGAFEQINQLGQFGQL